MSHLPSPSQNNLPPPPLPPASSLPPPPGVAAPPPRAFPIPPPLLSETSSAELARREQQQQQQLPPPQAQPPAQKKFIPPAPKLLSETSSAELDHASNPAPVAAPHPPPTLKPGIKAPPLLSETSSAELSKLEDPSKRRNSAEIQRNIQRHDSTSNRATLAAGAVKPITAPEEPPKKVEEDRKAAIKQGYLMKRSDLLGKWERFYFTVRNDGWMKYYKDENFKLGTSKGALDLRHAVFNDEPDKFPKKSKLCFSIFSRNRCTYFIVESDEKEYNEWAEAIRFIIVSFAAGRIPPMSIDVDAFRLLTLCSYCAHTNNTTTTTITSTFNAMVMITMMMMMVAEKAILLRRTPSMYVFCGLGLASFPPVLCLLFAVTTSYYYYY